MADEITLDGERYISSRRAAQLSGYAQDYIGQLARKGGVEARRVGGLWYISTKSLEAHQQKSSEYTPRIPEHKKPANPDTLISFDGRDYISASRASEITGYNRDYLGQLARAGKILSKQIGKRWYLDRESLMDHKESKDALLASVQSESVGLNISGDKDDQVPSDAADQSDDSYKSLIYTKETADLLPLQKKKVEECSIASSTGDVVTESSEINSLVEDSEVTQLPIRVVERKKDIYVTEKDIDALPKTNVKGTLRISRKTIFLYIFQAICLLFIGLIAFVTLSQVNASASSSAIRNIANSAVFDSLEKLLSQDLIYMRNR